jgi:hypothetical protein
MWGMHGGGVRARRLGGVVLVVAGVLLGASAVAQQGLQGALACYQQAERLVSLTSDQALWLCEGATSTAPAECYAASQAPPVFLSTEDAIDLCRCAMSTEPVACYHRGTHETFLEEQDILQLCSPSLAYHLLSDCRTSAYPAYPWIRPR